MVVGLAGSTATSSGRPTNKCSAHPQRFTRTIDMAILGASGMKDAVRAQLSTGRLSSAEIIAASGKETVTATHIG